MFHQAYSPFPPPIPPPCTPSLNTILTPNTHPPFLFAYLLLHSSILSPLSINPSLLFHPSFDPLFIPPFAHISFLHPLIILFLQNSHFPQCIFRKFYTSPPSISLHILSIFIPPHPPRSPSTYCQFLYPFTPLDLPPYIVHFYTPHPP